MEWTNDKAMSLIELYRDRPVLWDSRLKGYKDRNKRHNALMEIANSLGVGKEEVERKLKNLICHFSREIKKERDSTKSGAGSEAVYKSKWFCYERMLFLRDRNRGRGVSETEDPISSEADETHPDVLQKEDQKPELLEAPPTQSTSKAGGNKRVLQSPNKASSSRSKKPKFSETDEALPIMKDIKAGKELRDQYTVFGEQVGMQIRELPSPYARKVVKQVINTVLFDAEMGKYDIPSTTPYLQPSPYQTLLYSQPPTFGFPTVHGPIPGTSSFPSQLPNLHRQPKSTHLSQHSVTSPDSLAYSSDSDNTDND
ncbi:uncharacterized protein [Periplaneta americana]|uniref:uncharacterized protein n=1 Tax=Periplaneta americana TaxID=6978 RepID=UPI0037E9746D